MTVGCSEGKHPVAQDRQETAVPNHVSVQFFRRIDCRMLIIWTSITRMQVMMTSTKTGLSISVVRMTTLQRAACRAAKLIKFDVNCYRSIRESPAWSRSRRFNVLVVRGQIQGQQPRCIRAWIPVNANQRISFFEKRVFERDNHSLNIRCSGPHVR